MLVNINTKLYLKNDKCKKTTLKFDYTFDYLSLINYIHNILYIIFNIHI